MITYADIATEFRYLFRGSLRNSRQTGYLLLVIPLSEKPKLDLLWEKFGIAQGEAQRSQKEEAENGGSDANRSQ